MKPRRPPPPTTLPAPEGIQAARVRALFTAPYLGAALARMRLVARPGLGTMGVDGHGRVYYDPAVVEKWGVERSAGVLQHEVWHVLRAHSTRCTATGAAPRAWNIATDEEINDDLLAAKTPLPEEGIWPAKLGHPDGESAEQYYARLRAAAGQQTGQQGQPGQGQPQPGDDTGQGPITPGHEGSGVTGVAEPWELPASDNDGAISPAEQHLVARAVAEAIRAECAAGRGSLPTGIRRWADACLAPPTVPWQQVLAATMRGQLAKAGAQDYSYTRPSRRRVPGIVLPAMRARRPAVAVVVDTSGSISATELRSALSEVEGVCRAAGTTVTVLACDAEVHGGAQRVQRAASVRLDGGGGTNMGAGITAAVRAHADVVVVLTDGQTPWPDAAPRARVVVALLGDNPPPAPAWATTVRVRP